ncbi:hypothetical protein NEH83_36720 [Streptomyces sp. JUS-F4]|uniref:hypothetical protein n=1 Tax=Streptomyces TaxID=1883 RepID=UPI000A6EAE8E|nr:MULTISPECIES: hypothetical protein [Streptomyces]WKN12778.1 hypothetical protein NEH83_00340 [Streptomyces sp. JUS-F4]WKN19248.1 hypothetical protein NEH83_36720 [Streptomyces sp. JUS-F4]
MARFVGRSAVSTDAKNVWGPLTEGLNILHDLDLGDRTRALHQLGVTPDAHRTLVSRVNETLPQRDAALLVSSRQWPVLAHRTHRMAQQNMPFTAHLARIAPDTATWRTGPPACSWPPTTPLDQALPTGPRVSTTAARSRSTTEVPDTAPKQAASAEPAQPAHRQQTAAPAPRQGRGR